jgi:hypothetical protein
MDERSDGLAARPLKSKEARPGCCLGGPPFRR